MYQGCYSDSNPRTLSKRLSPSAKTVAACLAAARSAGYNLVGLEYGGECWAGKALTAGAKKLDYGRCNMVCEGNGLNVCGGSNVRPSLTLLSCCVRGPSADNVVPPHAGALALQAHPRDEQPGQASRAARASTPLFPSLPLEPRPTRCASQTLGHA